MNRSIRHHAFTLIELLVVVAIIVALLAILLPSLNKAVRLGQIAVCASNTRQIGTAHLSYAGDHFAHLPPVGRWANFQAMMYIKYEFAEGGSPKGFSSFGILEDRDYISINSDVFFCPLQTDANFMQSHGDPTHPNALPNNLPQNLLPADLAKYGWANKRAGFLRRNFGETTTSTITVQEVAGKPFVTDVISHFSRVETSHGDSLNVLYGDNHAEFRQIDTDETPEYLQVTYSPTWNPHFEKIWESFEH